MAHPYHHAESSARRYGGIAADYQSVHNWFDASKEHLAFFTHWALRHHSQGIFEAERRFGLTLTNSAGRIVPVRWIGEQHVKEDCQGRIPSLGDWFRNIQPEAWMANGQIDHTPSSIDGDVQAAWRTAVALQKTTMGLKDWMAEAAADKVTS